MSLVTLGWPIVPVHPRDKQVIHKSDGNQCPKTRVGGAAVIGEILHDDILAGISKTQLSSEPVRSTVPVTHDYSSNKKILHCFIEEACLGCTHNCINVVSYSCRWKTCSMCKVEILFPRAGISFPNPFHTKGIFQLLVQLPDTPLRSPGPLHAVPKQRWNVTKDTCLCEMSSELMFVNFQTCWSYKTSTINKINSCSGFKLLAYVYPVLLLRETGLVLVTKSFCERGLEKPEISP